MKHVEQVMGTAFSFDVRAPTGDARAPAAVAAAVAELHRIDADYSTYRPDSPISRIRRGELDEADAGEELRGVLNACRLLRETSRYLFDPWCVPGGVDPSGYVKGWALERAAGILSADGLRHFSINGGGDVLTRGEPAPGERWGVGIRHPADPAQLAAVIEVSDVSVATSGHYERPGHVIDPVTGEPASVDGVVSATVVGPDAAVADAYATALLIAGEPGFHWLTGAAAYHGMIISADGRLHFDRTFGSYMASG